MSSLVQERHRRLELEMAGQEVAWYRTDTGDWNKRWRARK
jgi:hypothetical protein